MMRKFTQKPWWGGEEGEEGEGGEGGEGKPWRGEGEGDLLLGPGAGVEVAGGLGRGEGAPAARQDIGATAGGAVISCCGEEGGVWNREEERLGEVGAGLGVKVAGVVAR